MQGTSTSWLIRTAQTFAHIERSLKAAPIEPGALYPRGGGQQGSSPISWDGWAAYEQRGNTNSVDEQRAKRALHSVWVYSDIQAIANEISSAELIVKERVGKKLNDVDNHPLELIWESPNPHMGRSFIMSFWAWSYTLASKAYLYWMPDAQGNITEVWPVPPFMITPVPDERDFVKGYAFKSGPSARPILIPPEYITFSHSVNLFDVRDGLSFLVPAMTAIEGDIAAAQWNANYFSEQNGIPDGIVVVPRDTLDPDLFRVRAELRDFFGGTKRGVGVARAGDLDYKPFGRSQKDIEFQGLRTLAAKEIDRALGFPEGYWSETANRANAEQARATMIAGAVWPLLVRLAEDMNAGFMPRHFGPEFRVEFRDIRLEDRQQKLAEFSAASSVLTIDELRDRFWNAKATGDVRGLMLIAEVTKGAPTPGSAPAQMLEEQAKGKADAEAEQQAQDAAAAIEAGAPIEGEVAPGDELPPAEGEPLSAAPPAPVEGEVVPMDETKGALALQDVTPDLILWQRKAIKRLKDKGNAAAPFETEAVSTEEHARIMGALKAAQTVEEVKAAFKSDDLDKLILAELPAATLWAQEASE